MRARTVPIVVLAGAVVALVASAGWAVARAGDDRWVMGRYGPGMMGYGASGRGEPVENLAGARRQAGRFADRLDLQVGEVMRFSNHYYAELEEDGGKPAAEVLVEPATGAVYLEYGPAMMWNTRYGIMSDFRLYGSSGMMRGGMMGPGGMMSGSGDPTWAPRPGSTSEVSPAQARVIATRWLERNGSGLVAAEPDRFPGYYTLHALRNGKVVGMLSVNEATGAVWYHWWHGRFVSMEA